MNYSGKMMKEMHLVVIACSAENGGNIKLAESAKKRLSEIKKKVGNGKNGKGKKNKGCD